MGKISFLAGFAAGYVLGARAGEQRYEQIKLQAGKAWSELVQGYNESSADANSH